MELDPVSRYLPSAGLGAVAGIRSLAAPAIASEWLERHHPGRRSSEIAQALASDTVGDVLTALAALEMLGDKLPFMPNRTAAPALIVRSMSGAVAGSAVASARRGDALIGAVLGAATAIAVTWATYHLRRKLVREYGVPSPLVGLIEDGLVAATGAIVDGR